jgi:DNA polymerase-3 subunit beta
MKLTIERSALTAAVSWAAQSLSPRPTPAILGGLKLTADEQALTISAFDYETSTLGTSPAQVDEPDQVVVSGRLLAEIVRALPDRPVALTTDGSSLLLACGPYRFTLQSMPLDDYPEAPAMSSPSGHVAGREFAEAVGQVALAAGRDDTVPMLTGVRLEAVGDRLRLVATDRYRLAVREIPWSPVDAAIDTSVLVPAKTLGALAKSLAHEAQAALALPGDGARSGRLLGVGTERRRAVVRLLDGEFIKYERIFPAELAGHAVVGTAALIEAVKGIALVAERDAPVRLSFAGGSVVVEAGSGDEARASVSLDAAVSGAEWVIAPNPAVLLDGLGALGAPLARISYSAPGRPTVLAGQSSVEAGPDETYRYLFLPVRI